jgi:hypothetical protein
MSYILEDSRKDDFSYISYPKKMQSYVQTKTELPEFPTIPKVLENL